MAPQTSARSYIDGWTELGEQLAAGSSWSGFERNCAYLNLRNGSFADASALLGFDQIEDGRALASADWDGDGDPDFWLKSRNGAPLRLLENRAADGVPHASFRLVGTTCNRDAIGAEVEVEAAGRRVSRVVAAGDGYLSQSSKELTFALPGAVRIERVAVRWPGGDEEVFFDLALDTSYRMTQGGGVEPLPSRRVSLPRNGRPLDSATGPDRLVLRAPLALPAKAGLMTAGSTGPSFVGLWASWCAPCDVELRHLSQAADQLAEAGLNLRLLCVDDAATIDQARPTLAGSGVDWAPAAPEQLALLEAVLEHVRGRPAELSLPTGFLLDDEGALQLIYLGAVDAETLADDAAAFGGNDFPASGRAPFPGRWAAPLVRDLSGLAELARARGLDYDADDFVRASTSPGDER
ncbi:MAG: ASPIC/UnbV domain-containing protein [Planctomycetota bacterium]